VAKPAKNAIPNELMVKVEAHCSPYYEMKLVNVIVLSSLIFHSIPFSSGQKLDRTHSSS